MGPVIANVLASLDPVPLPVSASSLPLSLVSEPFSYGLSFSHCAYIQCLSSGAPTSVGSHRAPVKYIYAVAQAALLYSFGVGIVVCLHFMPKSSNPLHFLHRAILYLLWKGGMQETETVKDPEGQRSHYNISLPQ